MQTPLPTPYDIIPPPGIPYSPSLLVWVLLISGSAVVFIIIAKLLGHLKNTEKSPPGAPENIIFDAIRKAKTATAGADEITFLTRALRRYVSFSESVDITSHSITELRLFLAGKDAPSLKALIESLLVLEQQRYSGKPVESLQLSDIENAFLNYSQQRRAS